MSKLFYDAIVIGSGFAGTFFVHRLLDLKPNAKVLLLEWGLRNTLDWQVANRRNSPPEFNADDLIVRTGMAGKRWPFTVGVGGSSNCWWANATRIHPNEFRLKTGYGVGIDWPIQYDDIERFYSEAEYIMNISGDDTSGIIFPRSRPFPQKPHRFSKVADTFRVRFPYEFFQMPQARARTAVLNRNSCCSNSVCAQCPVNAKFTVIGDLRSLLDDPRIELRTGAYVEEIITSAGIAQGVAWQEGDTTNRAYSDIVVLAANGIFNPHILLKSSITHGPVGKGLVEQIPINVVVDLDGMDDGDGSAHITGVGYNFSDGSFRSHSSGGFYELTNLPMMRPHKTRWRQTVRLNFLLDDFRDDSNFVDIDRSDNRKPHVHFEHHSTYARNGVERIVKLIPSLLEHLPVESIDVRTGESAGHAHLEGTTAMGSDPQQSVVDANLLHHSLRNLVVLGSSTFPTAAGANPTLTICALALRAADYIYRKSFI